MAVAKEMKPLKPLNIHQYGGEGGAYGRINPGVDPEFSDFGVDPSITDPKIDANPDPKTSDPGTSGSPPGTGGPMKPGGTGTGGTDTGTGTDGFSFDPKIVPGNVNPDDPGQINIVDYAGQIATNPSLAFTLDDPTTPQINESMFLSDRTPDISPKQSFPDFVNSNATYKKAWDQFKAANPSGTPTQFLQKYPALNRHFQDASRGFALGTRINPITGKPEALNKEATTVDQTAQATGANNRDAQGYDVAKALPDTIAKGQMDAAQGEVSKEAIIDPNDAMLDTEQIGKGQTETGKALNDFAELELDNIDPRATTKGQIAELQSEFVDDNGEPTIPVWAQGAARNVAKIAAFQGMTGSAATAVMSQALMEASITVATQDAQFFQTVSLQNLNNEQASIINKANVLAKMDLANADARLATAIQNSKNFMEMDLSNLANEQQASIINSQARQQAILEDSRQKNTERLFEAESQNNMDMFYDELNSQISKFNAASTNNMRQFNTNEINTQQQFNQSLENNREQFYANMQYNIDLANAKWRQTVTLTEAEQDFQAAALDVRNLVGMNVEQLNQIWDRSDALLDYLWKSTENELNRKQRLTELNLQGSIESNLLDEQGEGKLLGSIVGAGASAFFDWIF